MEFSISTVFFLYLIIPVVVIVFLWLVSEYRSRTRATQVEVERSMTCAICMQVYLYDKNESTSRCPSCGTLNDVPVK